MWATLSVALVGGDEFTLLLVHATGEQSHAVAAELRDELDAIRIGRAPGLHGLRASVGIAAVDAGAGSDDVLAPPTTRCTPRSALADRVA